ncbi:proteasome-associated ATPase [Brevundimonas phage vB_BpoS-Strzyga]|nr:proteasome-associated ATPase [Brevundimonas phage vB_BpoS-Strzyga]
MGKRDGKDRFGSGYDPMFGGGKMQLPPSRREQEYEQRYERQDPRQYQLRGCGDPNCMECNPEVARRPGGRPYYPSGGTVSGRMSSGNPFDSASFRDLEARMMGRILYGGFDAEPAKPAKPKWEDYDKAREAVAKWIAEAPEQAFADIIGNDEALGQLKDAIEAPVKHKELYEAYGMKMPKGALLSGPPGCGKTMFARAAASEMKKLYGAKKFEFISISGSELQSMYVGQTEGYIKAIFNFGREYQKRWGHPLLVFMDEADVLLPDRTGRVRRVASWEESQVATFLAEMDGMRESGVFMLLASNRPEVIDQAVLRDGRCDFKVIVKRPNHEAIEAIIRKNLAGILCAESDVETLVMAAVEGLFDPHKVILEDHLIKVNWKAESMEDLIADKLDKHFLLEHIISGAMAASIPARAKRYAFDRDKKDGVAKGVVVSDILQAINALFEENRNLDHSFALSEFRAEFLAEANARG